MTDPLTDAELAELERLIAATSSGAWHAGCFTDPASKCQCRYILSEGYCGSIAVISVNDGKNIGDGGNDSPPVEEARINAALIAAARNALPALLAEVRRAREARGNLRCALFTALQFLKEPDLAGCTTAFGVYMRRDRAIEVLREILEASKETRALTGGTNG